MSTTTQPAVKAVRERTFTIKRDPDGDRAKDVRYTVRMWRPTIADVYGRWLTSWEVLIKNPDRTQTVIARGENAMWPETLVSHVDAMLYALERAVDNRFGGWANPDHPDAWDRLHTLQLWAYYRQDTRSALRGSQTNIWGEWLGWRVARETRVAWARYFGWEFPDGYVKGEHLGNDNNSTD